MVLVLRKSSGFRILRKIYDKSPWYKMKAMYTEFKDYNPTLAAILPVSGVFLTAFAIVVYRLKCREVIPKYNETIVILRPDDPRVEQICKTDNLRIKYDPVQSELYAYTR
ncbi:hypothetical protein ANTQUA_LOCUS1467 [Anthophora quadrimaculata]